MDNTKYKNKRKFKRFQKFFYGLYKRFHQKFFGMQHSIYWQNYDHIHIGEPVHIAPGVSLIAANHDVYDIDKHEKFEDIIIEDYSWIGANATILPGVHLGPHTIVGAGSVVTKSFPEGYCVIAGNPATIIRNIEPEKCKENQRN